MQHANRGINFKKSLYVLVLFQRRGGSEMKHYEEPMLELIFFEVKNIITASVDPEGDGERQPDMFG